MRFKTFSLIVLTFLFACNTNNSNKKETSDEASSSKENTQTSLIIEQKADSDIATFSADGITLTEIKPTKNNKESVLTLTNISFKEGINLLQFSIENNQNYNITTIQNNYTIATHSNTKIEQEFLSGNNVFLAFLSNENNLGIKTNNATLLKNIVLNDEVLFDEKQAHLFYYLPQNNIAILDFCLVNTSLSENGNKIKVTFNGTTSIIVDKWASYQIDGLTQNKNTIRIELIDKIGKLIPGPFNDSGERSFTLKQNS
ncbi:MAG: hypothetical protein CMD31_05005 [Flavobacteriales bacterium]|nr:hypothetical protein [Flavobacteriales bacterium]|tara:strand:- start:30273 stop:31043 length:771 start_codon:yes stop_codon:yes gene_type:complete